MNIKKTSILFSLILLFFSYTAKEIRAVELITNGSFETGNFSGWTTVNATHAYWGWQNTASGFDSNFHTTSPQSGTRSVWNGVAANTSNPTFSLTQQFTIPAMNRASINWKHRFQLDNATHCTGAACGSATFAVEILNSSNVLLQTLYTTTVGPEAIADTGWVSGYAVLNGYAGQTIRVRFRNVVTATNAGPGMAEIDAVSVQAIPVTSAPASIGGRVTTDGGKGIPMATVMVSDLSGNTQTAVTNQFGAYYFENLEVGQTYILTANHKKYTFTNNTRVVNINDDLTGIDFQANP